MSVCGASHNCVMHCFPSVRHLLITINANVLMGSFKKFASTSSFLRVQLGFIEEVKAFLCFVMVFAQVICISKVCVIAY